MARSRHRDGRRRHPRSFKVGSWTATLSPEFAARQAAGEPSASRRRIERMLASLPESPNWDWARRRLAPLFERPGMDPYPADPAIHAVVDPGIAVGFGIDLDAAFVRVSRSMAERWETTAKQVCDAAMEHLRREAARLDPRRHVDEGVYSGHVVRAIMRPEGWASSLVLVPEQLTRLFGPHDQVLLAPVRGVLLSFSASTPGHVIADVGLRHEEADPHPLLLDPFLLVDGRLQWEGALADDAPTPWGD